MNERVGEKYNFTNNESRDRRMHYYSLIIEQGERLWFKEYIIFVLYSLLTFSSHIKHTQKVWHPKNVMKWYRTSQL